MPSLPFQTSVPFSGSRYVRITRCEPTRRIACAGVFTRVRDADDVGVAVAVGRDHRVDRVLHGDHRRLGVEHDQARQRDRPMRALELHVGLVRPVREQRPAAGDARPLERQPLAAREHPARDQGGDAGRAALDPDLEPLARPQLEADDRRAAAERARNGTVRREDLRHARRVDRRARELRTLGDRERNRRGCEHSKDERRRQEPGQGSAILRTPDEGLVRQVTSGGDFGRERAGDERPPAQQAGELVRLAAGAEACGRRDQRQRRDEHAERRSRACRARPHRRPTRHREPTKPIMLAMRGGRESSSGPSPKRGCSTSK